MTNPVTNPNRSAEAPLPGPPPVPKRRRKKKGNTPVQLSHLQPTVGIA